MPAGVRWPQFTGTAIGHTVQTWYQACNTGIGYEADLVIEHVARLNSRPEVSFVYNPAFLKGSVLSLLAAREVMTSGESVLVLDADVLESIGNFNTIFPETPIYRIAIHFGSSAKLLRILINAGRFDLKYSWMHWYFTPNFTSGRV